MRAFETYLGLPVDGTYDPELAARVEAHQGLLGQTPARLTAWSSIRRS